MAESQIIHARVPARTQKIAKRVLDSVGLTVSDVVRMLMTQIARDKSVPEVLLRPNKETLEAIKELEEGRNVKTFSTVDALIEDLNSDED